jgi:hypothetical protein
LVLEDMPLVHAASARAPTSKEAERSDTASESGSSLPFPHPTSRLVANACTA